MLKMTKPVIALIIILTFNSMLFGGQKEISLNFRDADVRTVLKFIAERSGFNIVIPSTVQGKVSVFLDNVTFEDAVKNITSISGLSYSLNNNILYIDQKDGNVFAMQIENFFYYPKYIGLNTLSDILKNYVTKDGKIVVDTTNGALIVTDSNKNISVLKTIIEKVDKPLKQVLIEAKIVEMNKSGSRDLGIQWGANYSPGSTSYYFPNSVSVGGGAQGYMVNLPVTEAAGAMNLLLGTATGSLLLDVRLQAMEKNGNAKIVSEPKIVTMNNQKALIESGVEFKYKVTTTDTTEVEEDSAKLSLSVTPQVTPDNNVLLNLQVEKSELDFSRQVDGYPLKITRKAETYLMVKDGETTIIGGLNQQTSSDTKKEVPYLSKIPVLGALFKSNAVANSLDELVIFITPKVLDGSK